MRTWWHFRGRQSTQTKRGSKEKACPSKKRVFTLERNKAITDEVNKLLAAKFIREVYYLEWLANVIIVKKANKK